MHLTPRETERLLLHSAAELARRRLARGSLLGASEAIALVCDEICELAWDGVPLEEIVTRAGQLVGPAQLVDGVPSAVPALQVEALFPHGSVLVHVDQPFGPPAADGPGSIRTVEGRLELAPGRERSTASLHNTGGQPIWVSSHVPLDQLNSALEVRLIDTDDRPRQFRLDVAAGTAVQVAPGEKREVPIVRIPRHSGAAREGMRA